MPPAEAPIPTTYGRVSPSVADEAFLFAAIVFGGNGTIVVRGMRTKHLVVVGASSGGIEALRELVSKLPEEFPAPLCIVLHTSPRGPGVLDGILNRSGPLPATNARDLERLQ